MKINTRNMLLGYALFAVANYAIAKATAGTLRTGTTGSLLTLNDALGKLNVLTYVLGTPVAPLQLPPGVTPAVLPTDTVVAGLSNILPFPQSR